MNDWPRVRLGEVLTRSGETVTPLVDAEYREITVRLWGKGVVERGLVNGSELSGRRFIARAGQFIASRIDARNGAMGLVPPMLDGALVTNDFPLFWLNQERLEPSFLAWLCKTEDFVELCQRTSEGTTNRVRLQEDRFLSLEIPLPPLVEQQRIVERIKELAAQIYEVHTLRQQAVKEAEALIMSVRAELFGKTTRDGMAQFDSVVIQLRGKSGLPLKEYLTSGKYPVIDQGQQFIAGYCDDTYRVLHPPAPVVVWGDHTTNVRLVDFAFIPGADGTKVFLPRDGILASFLLQFLKSIKYPELGYSRHYRYLKSVMMPIPQISEQHRIVAELDALQSEVDSIKLLQAETVAELNALLPAILDRAFKGEL